MKSADFSHCIPEPPNPQSFNPDAMIPYGVTVDHVRRAMEEFTEFLGFIDTQLCTREMARLEDMMMPANFSSLVGEFMTATIPTYCKSVVKNTYHNGHPVAGTQSGRRMAHGFRLCSGRPTDAAKEIEPKPFRFLMVCGALLERADWIFAGRSETSRRTITASVTRTGHEKMMSNWIYKAPALREGKVDLVALDPNERHFSD